MFVLQCLISSLDKDRHFKEYGSELRCYLLTGRNWRHGGRGREARVFARRSKCRRRWCHRRRLRQVGDGWLETGFEGFLEFLIRWLDFTATIQNGAIPIDNDILALIKFDTQVVNHALWPPIQIQFDHGKLNPARSWYFHLVMWAGLCLIRSRLLALKSKFPKTYPFSFSPVSTHSSLTWVDQPRSCRHPCRCDAASSHPTRDYLVRGQFSCVFEVSWVFIILLYMLVITWSLPWICVLLVATSNIAYVFLLCHMGSILMLGPVRCVGECFRASFMYCKINI